MSLVIIAEFACHNLLCRLRDGMSLREAITSSYADFRDLGWKNFIRRAQGLETKVKAKQDLSSA